MVIDLEIERIRRELREEAEDVRCCLRAEWKEEPHEWEVQHVVFGGAVQRLHDANGCAAFDETFRAVLKVDEAKEILKAALASRPH